MEKIEKTMLTTNYGTVSDWDTVKFIYIEAFPIDERQTCETILNRIESNQIKLLVVKLDLKVVGFALVWEVAHLATNYIEYIAVSKEYRNKAIGGFLLNALKDYAGNSILLVEIENPSINNLDLNKIKRVKFYEKNGFTHIPNIEYKMPSMDNEDESISMFLLKYTNQNNEIMISYLIELVNFLYLTVYQKQKNNLHLQAIIKTIS
ncbi:MAG: GNAT family N-acetyltransferase [Flavobacteriia bacterium]|nr:GNAT family N-acetyltransferase [Flavobacteriia bacterium]